MSDQLGFEIFCWVVGLVFLGAFIGNFRRMRLAERCLRWPTARGKFLSAGATRSGKMFFTAEIEYAYEVNGVEYRSRQMDYSLQMYDSYDRALGAALSYKMLPYLDVYYDPEHPEEAVLKRLDAGELYPGFLFFSLFCCALFYGIYFLYTHYFHKSYILSFLREMLLQYWPEM
jgi:hypothetical protein